MVKHSQSPKSYGQLCLLLIAAKYPDSCELFTKKEPDVRFEMNWGVYDRHEGTEMIC